VNPERPRWLEEPAVGPRIERSSVATLRRAARSSWLVEGNRDAYYPAIRASGPGSTGAGGPRVW